MSMSTGNLLVLGLTALVVVVWILVLVMYWRRRRNARPAGLAPAPASVATNIGGPAAAPALVEWDQVEALGQDDYAALLERDRERLSRFDYVGPDAVRCHLCQTPGVLVTITHPIWDGPFHGAGTGRVDVRDVRMCPRCELFTVVKAEELGLWPALDPMEALSVMLNQGQADGRPIRLPWLDPLQSPIALHPALWDRPAFHNLLLRVQRGAPPPPAPSRQPHRYVYYQDDVLQHAPPAARPQQRCEVCDQPAGAAIHDVTDPA